jgi:hypothetical protein
MLIAPSPSKLSPTPTPASKRHLRLIRLIPSRVPDLTAHARLLPPEIVDLTAFAIVCPPEIEDMTEHAQLLTPPAIPVALYASTQEVADAMLEVYALAA